MGDEVTDQTRQQIFKTTYRRKIDLRRMTAVCKGDRELARSLVHFKLRFQPYCLSESSNEFVINDNTPESLLNFPEARISLLISINLFSRK